MIELFVLLVVALIGFVAGRYRYSLLQNSGEAIVAGRLLSAFPGPDYHLMNNITLKVSDGTTQIDHILFSRYGIFVIETKDYKGWIFGNPKQASWTQVIYKRKFKFQNPIFQNMKHLHAVKKLLDFLPQDAIQSIVVFAGQAEFKTAIPQGVCTVNSLVKHLEHYSVEKLSENRMQFCVGRIETHRFALTKETDVLHRANLARRFGDMA